MGPLRFAPIRNNETVDDCQKAAFFMKMHELQKRFLDGSISPEFTLQALQNAIEGKYVATAQDLKVGRFKKFGKPVELHDNMFALGYGAESFFKEKYAQHALRFAEEEEKKLVPLFTQKNEEFMDNVTLAPYRFPRLKNSELITEINQWNLFPKISLGHLDIMLLRAASSSVITSPGSVPLYKGSEGNYFPIKDINGNDWIIWVWLHGDGSWNYRFNSMQEFGGNVFNQTHARIWLLDTTEQAQSN